MTLDDLYAVLSAIQVDARVQSDKLISLAEGAGKSAAAPEEKTPSALDKLTAAAAKAQAGLTAFVGVFDKVLSSLGGGMAKFVQLANPATVFKFNMAVENAMSAMGRVLVPVMEKFTVIVQDIGNAIESLSPHAKSLLGGLAGAGGLVGVFTALTIGAKLLIASLGPIPAVLAVLASVLADTASGKAIIETLTGVFGSLFETLADAVMLLEPLFDTLAKMLAAVAEGVKILIDGLREEMGLAKYDPNRKTAIAVRQGGMGDLRGYANRAYTSGFNSGGGVAEKHLGVAIESRDLLKDILLELGVKNGSDGKLERPSETLAGLLPSERPSETLARMASTLFD